MLKIEIERKFTTIIKIRRKQKKALRILNCSLSSWARVGMGSRKGIGEHCSGTQSLKLETYEEKRPGRTVVHMFSSQKQQQKQNNKNIA